VMSAAEVARVQYTILECAKDFDSNSFNNADENLCVSPKFSGLQKYRKPLVSSGVQQRPG
jgi:hypothetical protein